MTDFKEALWVQLLHQESVGKGHFSVYFLPPSKRWVARTRVDSIFFPYETEGRSRAYDVHLQENRRKWHDTKNVKTRKTNVEKTNSTRGSYHTFTTDHTDSCSSDTHGVPLLSTLSIRSESVLTTTGTRVSIT